MRMFPHLPFQKQTWKKVRKKKFFLVERESENKGRNETKFWQQFSLFFALSSNSTYLYKHFATLKHQRNCIHTPPHQQKSIHTHAHMRSAGVPPRTRSLRGPIFCSFSPGHILSLRAGGAWRGAAYTGKEKKSKVWENMGVMGKGEEENFDSNFFQIHSVSTTPHISTNTMQHSNIHIIK